MGTWFKLLQAVLVCLLALGNVGLSAAEAAWGGLYPRESSSREVRSLDGLWNFRVAPRLDPDQGFREEWYTQPLKKSGPVMSMAVPSSYNDVTQDKALREHIGWVWYDRTFFAPSRWQEDNQRVFLRFGSAHYQTIMYLNGVELTSHEVGHLPIRGDITDLLQYSKENLLTVAINNVLTPQTIPQGKLVYHNESDGYPNDYFIQTYDFDFFNYAGIHRPVFIYTTPQSYIEDIVVTTDIDGTDGMINYNVTSVSGQIKLREVKVVECFIDILDKDDKMIANATGCSGSIRVPNANLWWPYLMSENPGYLYTMMVSINDGGSWDTYPQKVGIRTVGLNSTTISVNGAPIYIRGLGKHEDSDIRGKGLDYPLIVKDFNLMKWLGANCFRTSHYPYAEEIMDMADQEGIMVIDESPAVNLINFDDQLMATHISVMQEIVRRDKNRPSVIMWSVANEPKSAQAPAQRYFSAVVNATKAADPTRPVTAALNAQWDQDLAGSSMDVIMVNRYFSWYHDAGHLELIENQTLAEFSEWRQLHNKPILISEYGAGAIAGLHKDPAVIWSEEYQANLLLANFRAFDTLRARGYFVGEMIWNFADFETDTSITRVAGNRKGMFTRNRQPKLAAHLLRQRYHDLAGAPVQDQHSAFAKLLMP